MKCSGNQGFIGTAFLWEEQLHSVLGFALTNVLTHWIRHYCFLYNIFPILNYDTTWFADLFLTQANRSRVHLQSGLRPTRSGDLGPIILVVPQKKYITIYCIQYIEKLCFLNLLVACKTIDFSFSVFFFFVYIYLFRF